MKISCPSCAAKYSIADEKVQDRLAKIRCRKCGATIVIDGKVSPANVYTTAGDADEGHSAAEHHEHHEHHAEGAAGGTEYSVDFGEGDQRTLSLNDLVAAYNAGQVTGETFIWSEGFEDWKALQDVPEVVDALNAAAAAPSPAPALAVAAAPAPAPAPAPTPAPARAAAAARPGRAGAADLFGRIESAGSEEEEVSTSAADQQSGASLGSLGGSATGARNESSVLFSLSALTAGASTSKPSATAQASKPGAASREDSGLIDLKALTAAATKSDAGAAGMAAAPLAPLAAPPLGVAAPLGLGAPMPLGGTTGLATSTDFSMPQQKSKTGLFIAIAVGIVVAAVAVALILKPEPPPPPVVVAPTPVPTTPAAAAPAPTQEELTAKPPATGTQESEDAPDAGSKTAAKPGSYRRSGGGTAPKKSGGGAAASEPAAPAAAAPPKPKKNPCGCASGDLQCAMRCAAGG